MKVKIYSSRFLTKVVMTHQGTSDTQKAEMVTPGESQGLEILLDRHSDRQTCKQQTKVMNNAQYQRRNSFCHGDRIQGHDLYCSKKPSSNCFQVHLGRPTEFPSLKSRHFNLAPGKRHSIEISATKVTEQCQGQGSNMSLIKDILWEGSLNFFLSYNAHIASIQLPQIQAS